MGRHINAPVFTGGGKAEYMIVLVDRTPYGAEGIVAIG
jgi:hypothetical protein